MAEWDFHRGAACPQRRGSEMGVSRPIHLGRTQSQISMAAVDPEPIFSVMVPCVTAEKPRR